MFILHCTAHQCTEPNGGAWRCLMIRLGQPHFSKENNQWPQTCMCQGLVVRKQTGGLFSPECITHVLCFSPRTCYDTPCTLFFSVFMLCVHSFIRYSLCPQPIGWTPHCYLADGLIIGGCRWLVVDPWMSCLPVLKTRVERDKQKESEESERMREKKLVGVNID